MLNLVVETETVLMTELVAVGLAVVVLFVG